MRLLIALVLAALSAGCGTPECGSYNRDGVNYEGNMCEERLTRELRVSSAFSPEQQEAIVRAADDWAEWTNWRVSLSVVTVDQAADVYPSHDMAEAWMLADQLASSGVIRIRPTVPAWQVRAIAAHELGHSFGLGHVRPRDQAMHPDSNAPLSAADVEHFDRLYANRH